MPNIFISSNNSSTAVCGTIKEKCQKKNSKDFGEFGDIIW